VDELGSTLAALAAGYGNRFSSENLKQMVIVHGYLLLEYAAYTAFCNGFDRLVILIRRNIENEFDKLFGKRIRRGIRDIAKADFAYAYQDSLEEVQEKFPYRKKMWGTGQAVLSLQDAIDEPFATINADDYYGDEAFGLLSNFLNNGNPEAGKKYGWVGYRLKNAISSEDPVNRGIGTLHGGTVLNSIKEIEGVRLLKSGEIGYQNHGWHTLDPNTLTSLNVWAFNPTIFPELQRLFNEFICGVEEKPDVKKEFYLPWAVNSLVKERKITVKVLPTNDQSFGMTYDTEYDYVKDQIGRLIGKKYPEKLWG
jgi:hypothetical protein